MAIPEAQLDTWDAQGSVKQSKDTYASVKGTLEDSKAPYYSRSYDAPYLQGSYGNDTNVGETATLMWFSSSMLSTTKT